MTDETPLTPEEIAELGLHHQNPCHISAYQIQAISYIIQFIFREVPQVRYSEELINALRVISAWSTDVKNEAEANIVAQLKAADARLDPMVRQVVENVQPLTTDEVTVLQLQTDEEAQRRIARRGSN